MWRPPLDLGESQRRIKMGTPYSDIFNRFLSKILEDEWEGWAEEDIERDLSQILESAIPWFKFPRNSSHTLHDNSVIFLRCGKV